MSQNPSYTDTSIQTLNGLDPIRTRPTAFINSLDHHGQIHIIKELLDNSYDELHNVAYTGYIDIYLFKTDTHYQVLVRDNGRGIPLKTLVPALTCLWTSGKYNTTAYTTSSGTYGLGAKCQTALSTRSKTYTFREEGIGILYTEQGNIRYHIPSLPNTTGTTGTVILYELETEWVSQNNRYQFLDIEQFYTVGYIDLIKLIQLNDVFIDNIITTVHKVETPIPDKVWEDRDGAVIHTWLTSLDTTVVYRTDTNQTKDHMLLDYLAIDSPVTWRYSLQETEHKHLQYKVYILLVKNKKSAQITLLNNVYLKVDTNSVAHTLYTYIHHKVKEHISQPEIAHFYSQHYRLPIILAASVRYSGAQFAGTNKLDFKDKKFEKMFHALLNEYSDQLSPVFQQLYEILQSDIEAKYNMFYNKPILAKDSKKLLLELYNAGNYTACRTTDRSKAELFIVEGMSAGHLKKVIDPEYQAIFETRGKPLNAINYNTDRDVAFQRLKKNEIFADLIKIINISPKTEDLSQCNFSKIIIATDADPDGEHIVAIYLSNFYVLNPKLIESGMVHVATPPLFTMNVGNKKIYLRNKVALYDARIDLLYRNTLIIHYQRQNIDQSPQLMTDELYRDFCHYVLDLGEVFDHVSNLLNIPILVLERLCYGIQYLVPEFQLDKLQDMFVYPIQDTYVKFTYNSKLDILVISIGEQDVPIALHQLGNIISTMLLPHLKSIYHRSIQYYVTTPLTRRFVQAPCSIMQLYLMFKTLNNHKLIRVDRYKGLGEMDKEDMRITIADPRTRRLCQITSLGDLDKIVRLMGRDSTPRKHLMLESGSVDSALEQ